MLKRVEGRKEGRGKLKVRGRGSFYGRGLLLLLDETKSLSLVFGFLRTLKESAKLEFICK